MEQPKDDAAHIVQRLSLPMIDYLRDAATPVGKTTMNGNSTIRALLARGLVTESDDQPANPMRTTWTATDLGRGVIDPR